MDVLEFAAKAQRQSGLLLRTFASVALSFRA